jgi:uncharacterized protein YneF (UPF0154 family)
MRTIFFIVSVLLVFVGFTACSAYLAAKAAVSFMKGEPPCTK